MAVTRLDITTREPLVGGKPFGVTGAYKVPREEHLGNGVLLQQEYTLAWCVWQWVRTLPVVAQCDDAYPAPGRPYASALSYG